MGPARTYAHTHISATLNIRKGQATGQSEIFDSKRAENRVNVHVS